MSIHFNRLKETFEKNYPRYKSWVEENRANFPPQKIDHGAFTMQEASDLLLEFCETIKIALKDKEQCLRHVSKDEIIAINTDLDNMLLASRQNNYSYVVEGMEELIPRMRPFQFLSMEKMDEKRYGKVSDMDKSLNDIKILQEVITSNINKAKSDRESLHNLMESITEKNNEFGKLINEDKQEINNLETLHKNAIDRANWIGQYVDKIENILNGANEQKSKIDSFVNLIQEREEKITSQNVATEAYEAKLKDFSEKYDLNMEEAKKLIDEAHEALNLSTARGLGKAFLTRQEKLEDKKVKIAWLVMGGLAVVGAIVIGVEFFDKEQNINIESVIGRTLLMTVLIGVAAFCSKQYARNRVLEEDYAYKVALAASYPGLATEFEKAESRKEYVVKLLDEILQDPQRARHDKESLADSHPVMAGSKKILKKNETKTDESP